MLYLILSSYYFSFCPVCYELLLFDLLLKATSTIVTCASPAGRYLYISDAKLPETPILLLERPYTKILSFSILLDEWTFISHNCACSLRKVFSGSLIVHVLLVSVPLPFQNIQWMTITILAFLQKLIWLSRWWWWWWWLSSGYLYLFI